MTYQHGIIVLRAQPFHIGHQSLIDKMRTECTHATVILGSIQEAGSERNPFSFDERKQMIRNVYPHINIMGIADINNAVTWGHYVLDCVAKTFPDLPKPDIYYAGSDYDAQWFEAVVPHISILDRRRPDFPYVTASMVRDMLKYKDERWKNFIPPVNHDLLKTLCERNNA